MNSKDGQTSAPYNDPIFAAGQNMLASLLGTLALPWSGGEDVGERGGFPGNQGFGKSLLTE